jgi:hypothetical protein
MTATEIQRAIKANPFQPFELITGDGGKYPIPTRDHIALAPSGRIAAVFFDNDSAAHLDVFLVTALRYGPPPRNVPRRKSS